MTRTLFRNASLRKWLKLRCLLFLCLALAAVGQGCERTKIAQPATPVIQDERIAFGARSLTAVTRVIPPTILLRAVNIQEESDRSLALALAPPTSDPLAIAAQYNQAYTKNYEILVRMLSSPTPNAPEWRTQAIDEELAHLSKLRDRDRSPDNIVLIEITVDGPESDVAALKTALTAGGDK